MLCGQCELIIEFNKQQLSDFFNHFECLLMVSISCKTPTYPKNPKICDPILVTLLKMRPHYSHSSLENATLSSSTSLLASCKEYPANPPGNLPQKSSTVFSEPKFGLPHPPPPSPIKHSWIHPCIIIFLSYIPERMKLNHNIPCLDKALTKGPGSGDFTPLI